MRRRDDRVHDGLDTTGIEPDIALVSTSGWWRRIIKIANGTVPEALRRLGYSLATPTRFYAISKTTIRSSAPI